MCRLRGGYGTGVRPSSPVELFGGAVAGKTTVFRCKKAMIFARKSRVFRAFSAFYSCLSGRIGPGGARGILFGRGASSIAGTAAAWCAVGAAARIRVYGQQVGMPDTFKGWPPGLLSSTTGEQINDAAHDLQAGGCSPQRPKQTDDTTGSPRSPSDTFGRGIARLLGDRRNLGRFRAIAGQWRATFSEGWPPGLFTSTIPRRIILRTCAIWSTHRAGKLPDNARQLTTQDQPTVANSNRSNNFSRFSGVFLRKLSNQSNKQQHRTIGANGRSVKSWHGGQRRSPEPFTSTTQTATQKAPNLNTRKNGDLPGRALAGIRNGPRG